MKIEPYWKGHSTWFTTLRGTERNNFGEQQWQSLMGVRGQGGAYSPPSLDM